MRREDIVTLLDTLGADQITSSQGKDVQSCCVFAAWTHPSGKDERPSMGVLIKPGQDSLFNCFACSERGTLTTMVRKLEEFRGERMDALLRWVIDAETKTGDEIVDAVPDWDAGGVEEIALSEDLLEPFGCGSSIPAYGLERGLVREGVKRWSVGYDQPGGRMIFPVRDRFGVLVGAVGRDIYGRKPKYKYLWHGPDTDYRFRKHQYLYGEHLITRSTRKLVIVEGILDAVIVDQALREDSGFEDTAAVALLGSHIHRLQADKVVRYSDEAILFLDNDEIGWEGRTEARDALQRRVLVRGVEYPYQDDEDPGSMALERIRDVVRDAPMVLSVDSP